jgi:L-ascorbate metabolism protein UlaG (beta-lactamase superfamily)
MKVKKADDYQSWFIEERNEALLIDPWFDLSLVDGKGWFLQRKKEKKSHLTKEEISLVKNIIITAPFEDHLHLNTLKEFPTANIWCSSQVRSILLKKNLPNKLNEFSISSNFIGALEVRVYPAGFPYNTTAYCLQITNDEGFSVFHEGHVVNKKVIQNNDIKADIAILTAEEVKFFGLLTLSMSLKNTMIACNLLEAKKLFITGSNPLKNTGFINHFLKLNKLDNDVIDDKIKIFYEAGTSYSS